MHRIQRQPARVEHSVRDAFIVLVDDAFAEPGGTTSRSLPSRLMGGRAGRTVLVSRSRSARAAWRAQAHGERARGLEDDGCGACEAAEG